MLAQLRRQSARAWQQPLHPPSVAAFEQIDGWRRSRGAALPVVIDAGCGTGISTARLAERHGNALLIGVDRSAARLRRVGAANAPRSEGRVLWARIELETFWRLARAAQWPVEAHYLLYPNPWPKSAHLGRRWHGHPVFPTVLGLGLRTELRCNWRIYAEEFSQASRALGYRAGDPEPLVLAPEQVLSPFEAKYLASGHQLWRVITEGEGDRPAARP